MKAFSEAGAGATAQLSIVCVTRNVAHCLRAMLQSYRNEQTDACELIVLDGASTDETWDIVLDHRDLISSARCASDAGIYDAWNKALPLCRGRYVAFIGADDVVAPGALKALAAACQEDDGRSHVVAGYNIRTQGGVPVVLVGSPFERCRILHRMPFAHVLAAHRLDWLRERGGFDASFRSAGDYELMVRDRATLQVKVIPHVLAWIEDGGVSRQSLSPHFEHYRARRKNAVPTVVCAALLAKAMVGTAWRRLGTP